MPENIVLSSDWNNLYITFKDTSDRLGIYGYSWSAPYRNYTLRFAGGRTAEIDYSSLKLIYQPLDNEISEPHETGGNFGRRYYLKRRLLPLRFLLLKAHLEMTVSAERPETML